MTSNQITLKQCLECINYKITEGSDYGWHVFGDNAYQLDSWNGKHQDGGHTINIVFDKKTQLVYELQAWDDAADRQYRWIHPDYIDSVKTEYQHRNLDFTTSLDDNTFIDIELAVDILEKATAIANDLPYDDRIQFELDLPDEEMHTLMRLAHTRDITLNQLVKDILREVVAKLGPANIND